MPCVFANHAKKRVEGTELVVKSVPQSLDKKEDTGNVRIIDMPRDGSCFFCALSYFLHGNVKYHQEIRELIVGFILANWAKFSPFLPQTGERSFANVQDYRKQASKSSYYATPVEIQAACEHFNIRIKVLRSDSEQTFGSSNDRCMSLRHTGPFDDGHFGLILSTQNEISTPKSVEQKSKVDSKLRQENFVNSRNSLVMVETQ